MKPHARVALTVGATAALLGPLIVAVPSAAHKGGVLSDPITTGLGGPLSLTINDHGISGGSSWIVTENFAGKLTRVRPKGKLWTVLRRDPAKVELGGVESRGDGTMFTLTGRRDGRPVARLMMRDRDGVHVLGRLQAFEARHNPDGRQRYGFRDLGDRCATRVPDGFAGKPYRGRVDSHPYATAWYSTANRLVADAGGNTILRVHKGTVSVVAVLPPQRRMITRSGARSLGLPGCTIGHRYWFEPVPTDVEVGPGGNLLVSLLPGGPEDASLGARGSVYRIDPATGAMRKIGRGFLGAVDLAVTSTGRVYVAELFGHRVSRIVGGLRHKVVSVTEPGALEYGHGGTLFVTSHVFGDGDLRSIQP